MLEEFARALTGSQDEPSLLFQRTYSTTATDLWDALTDPVRAARWLGSVEGEPRTVGDRFLLRFADASDQPAELRVIVCEPLGRLVLDWQWQGERPSSIEALLQPDGERTRLSLVHTLQESQHVADYGGGWEDLLAALSLSLGEAGDVNDVEAIARATWRNMQTQVLELEWLLPASVDAVWRAFTTADGLRTWWWNHWSGVEFDLDVRPGGAYRITAPQQGIAVEGEYLVVNAPRHLAFTWRWTDAEGVSRDEACDLRFVVEGGQTRLRLRHTGPWADSAPAENYRLGWEHTVGVLLRRLGAA